MVSVLRGGVGGCALVLSLTSLAGLPGPSSDTSRDEQILQAARVGTRPADVLSFLRKQVLDSGSKQRAAEWIGQLSHDSFRVRETAVAQLIRLGPGVLPLLEQAKASSDLETRRRAERCVQAIRSAHGPEVVAAALRQLSLHRPSGATKVLLDYAAICTDRETAEQLCETLLSIGIPDASANTSLEHALASTAPATRAVAGYVLIHKGSDRQRALAKNLMTDADPAVRLHVARSLVGRRDSDALPALLSLLDDTVHGDEAEDILVGLAGETGPAIAESDSRRQVQIAWQNWWESHQKQFAFPTPTHGHGPVARAKSTAQSFLGALVRGDFAAFKRTVEVPFHLGGLVTFTAGDDFDQLFRQVLDGPPAERKHFAFTITGMGNFAEFRRNLGQLDLDRLQHLDARKLQVVFVEGRFGSDSVERGAMLVRLTAARAFVIGIYQVGHNDQ